MPSIVELAELCDAVYGTAPSHSFENTPPAVPVLPKSPANLAGNVTLQRPLGGVGVPFLAKPGTFPPQPCPPGGNRTAPQQKVSNPLNWTLPASTRLTWTCKPCSANRFGFYAATYERKGAGRVLAFRGTLSPLDARTASQWLDSADDVGNDLILWAGKMPPQAIAALDMAKSAGLGAGDYVTGHSLGGALALIVAAHRGLPAVTFNAPGVMDSCVASGKQANGLRHLLQIVGSCVHNRRVKNIRVSGDPISSFWTTGLQSGASRQSLIAPAGMGKHGIATCIAAVRKEAANYDPLKL